MFILDGAVVEDRGFTTPCHVWTRGKQSQGYGSIRGKLAHRVAYEVAKGPIPDELEVDHLCRVRECVNPDHLEAVTHEVNMERAFGDTCNRGHDLAGANLSTLPDGRRRCRKCHALRESKYRANRTPEQQERQREHQRRYKAKLKAQAHQAAAHRAA